MRYFLVLALLASSAAYAQDATTPQNSGQPIEITATETVEWLRDQKQYVARKDVIVKQGAMEIHADLLTADYREGTTSSMEIWQMTAEGNVQIKDETNTAYGDKGVYDVTKGVAVLTGNDLKLVSPDQTVTASERMEYHANERLAKAIGNATVKREKDTVKADTLTAYFKNDATDQKSAENTLGGDGNIDRLEADGHVVITTPTEKLYGAKGVYRAATNTASLSGKVKIERGKNVLEGERAEVDLNTNISKMFGSEKDGGRVRGLFFPGSESKSQGKPAIDTTTPPSNPPVNGGRMNENLPPQSGGNEGGVVPVAPTPPAKTTEAVSPTLPAPAPAKVSPRIEY